MHLSFKEDGRRLAVITLAALILALNLDTFVHTGGIYPGGVTGLTVLIRRIWQLAFGFELPYMVVNILLNAVPVYIGFRYVGKKLAVYSIYFVVLSSFLADALPSRVLTSDTLLISIFGGMINGVVISMCLASNANTGGTDFIAMFISQKTGADSFNFILGVNAVLLTVAGILFGWEKALYSIIFQYASTQVLHALYRKYQQNTLFIVTNHPEMVCASISRISRHGATILHGEGAYRRETRTLIYSVVSSAEVKKVLRAVKEADPEAFVNSIHTDSLRGRFYQPPTE